MVHKETRTDAFTEERLDDVGMNGAEVLAVARDEATKLERSIRGVVEVGETSLAPESVTIEWRVHVPDDADETLVTLAISFARQRFHGRTAVPEWSDGNV